ncbi:MAG TPA: carboxypeptidase regulatory-like domain-containing protein, partial [Vicinamibacterales bacterium]|nr:carboxypeptidase regulatory-like domain-containing protein [Vicinamibacterales bacterium]
MTMSSRFASSRRALFGACLALALGAYPVAAQDTGIVSGTIVDNTNQVVPGATITLINEATVDTRTTASGPQGVFIFRAVPPGSYTVKIELSGFRTHEQKKTIVNASGQVDLGNVKLDVGTVSEVVSVVAEGAHIETKNSDYSGLLTATQISQIQSRGRDVVNLLRLLPGVHYENDIEAMGDSFGSQIPNISGMRKHWNQVTVDGLNGNELSGTNRMNSSINLDAIAEVKVLLNTYKAEFGHSGGANIEIVSKSGSSTYQGSAYWYGKRDAWNANAWENNKAGLPKPKLHIDTPGFNLGGPVRIPGLYDAKDNARKLFFFYSFEAPQVQKPGPIRLYRMPTALERQGDFSQTVDANGRLMFIKDPSASGACSVTTGGPGCFQGNIIPVNRIDPNALALMKMMPLPNTTSVNNSYNFQRQETSTNPRFNNLVRLDGHPSGNNSVWGSVRTWSSAQYGSEITAGPAKWGFFDGSYVSGDNSINGGWNHVFGASGVNELSGGYRRATEGFGTKTDADLSKILKSNVGYSLGQFTNLNTLGVIPQMTFGVSTTGTTSPDFTYDSRLGSTAYDYLMNVRDNLTLNRGKHTMKFGGHLEFMENNEARGGTWMGQFQFNNNNNNPLNTNFAFSNMLLGVYQQYTETSRYGDTHNRQLWSEWYGQDTWRATSRLTIDYGLRFLWYTPYWRPDQQIANFDPTKYSAAIAPRLYQPALVNGTRVAIDPVTGQTLNQIFIGAYVPNSGNQANGMVLQTDAGVPRGFRNTL